MNGRSPSRDLFGQALTERPPHAAFGFTTHHRQVVAQPWGAVSVPKQTAVGSVLDMQVAFGTETFQGSQVMRVDLHGYTDSEGMGVIRQVGKVSVTGGVTKPYSAKLMVPAKPGLAKVAVVMYVSEDGSYKERVLSCHIVVPVGTVVKTR